MEIRSLASLQARLLRDAETLQDLVSYLLRSESLPAFVPADLYIDLKEKITPTLGTYPRIRVWHLGASDVSTTYCLSAILLEANLYDRTRIYATEINEAGLLAGKKAFEKKPITKTKALENYSRLEGKLSLSQIGSEKGKHFIFSKELLNNTHYFIHNLLSDSSFNEFQLILVSTPLHGLEHKQKERVYSLLDSSLSRLGFLGFRDQKALEEFRNSIFTARYEPIGTNQHWFRRKQ